MLSLHGFLKSFKTSNVILRRKPVGAFTKLSYSLRASQSLRTRPRRVSHERPSILSLRALSKWHQRPYRSDTGESRDFSKIGPYAVVGTFTSVCVGLWGFYQYEAHQSESRRRRSKWLDIIDKHFLCSQKALDDGRWWTLVSNTFMHQSPSHLVLNMLGLYQWGIPVTIVFGPLAFLGIWVGGAISSNLAGLYWNQHKLDPWLQRLGPLAPQGMTRPNVTYLGASGSILSFLGLLTCFQPRLSIAVFPIPIGMPLIAFSTVFVGGSLAAMVQDWSPSIGHSGHVGGLVFGVLAWYAGLRRGFVRGFPKL